MKDLTRGSIVGLILSLAAPTAAGMAFQMLFHLVDLYFVAQLGDTAVAGVSAAGNATLIVMAVNQVLGAGTVALIAHAAGRKDRADANLVFNQAIALSAALGSLAIAAVVLLGHRYMVSVAADEASAWSGATYLYWFAPGLALQFALATLVSALRGTGLVQFGMVAQIVGVLLNIVLAPILVAGWGTGRPLGVAGAGLASSIAIAVSTAMLWMYFRKLERYVSVEPSAWRPRMREWRRILGIGLPAGGELAINFVYSYAIYLLIARFGVDAQAGFAIGTRISFAIGLPVMAIAVAAGSVAGQNFGARNWSRVQETFHSCLVLCAVLMASVTLVACWRPDLLIAIFATDSGANAIGTEFLRLASLTFLAQGVIFTCSSIFQGLGNSLPALLTSLGRLVSFGAPALWMAQRPDLRIEQVWYLTVAVVIAQALASAWLMRVELRRRSIPLAAELPA